MSIGCTLIRQIARAGLRPGAWLSIPALAFTTTVAFSAGVQDPAKTYIVVPPSSSRSVTILYYPLYKHHELTDKEIADILRTVNAEVPAHPRVWFLQIHTSSLSGSRSFPHGKTFIDAYFTPTDPSSRVRRGRAVKLAAFGTKTEKLEINVLYQHSYVQILDKDADPGAEPMVPLPRDLPFYVESTLTDETLVDLHECAREGARQAGYDDAPLSFDMKDLDAIDAYVGYGGGIVITCSRSTDGYKFSFHSGGWVAP